MKENKEATMQVYDLKCEYGRNPLGIDTRNPRFSWKIKALKRGAAQSAYQIKVYNKINKCMWDSGKITDNNTVNALYDGDNLQSREEYSWELTVWDGLGKEVPVERGTFETAFLHAEEWKAVWIRGENLFRREFSVEKEVEKARVYICGLGYYELYINGEKVGDHVLDPAWTDYDQKACYVTYDITESLKKGGNAVGVMLGNGRYSPYETTIAKNWHPLKKYGDSPVLIYQQHITYKDGTEELLVSDTSWKTSEGPIVFDDIYDGERYDARMEQEGWNKAGFDETEWADSSLVTEKMGTLVSQGTMPAIKVIKHRSPVEMTQPEPDVYLYDFGQNFSGWVHLTVSGKPGDTVRIHYAELKDEETGMLCPNTNRNAEALDTYTCKGESTEVYEPHFTYHGFRYIELRGYPGTPSIDSVEARVVHSSVERIGSFSCGNELINKIHSNFIWTQVSNLHSVPTDCCQRDERMGWVGDAQLSAEAAVYNFDMASFYSKFEGDIRDSQLENGSVAGVSPAYWSCYPADPTYATACVEFPWIVSRYYDDKRILEESLEAMAKWVDYLGTQEDEDGIVSFGLFGDWCPPMHANPVDTPFEITSTWYYCHDALVVSRMAEQIGKQDMASKYYEIFKKTAAAFNKRFLKGDRYSASRFSDEELEEKIKSWLNVLPPEEQPAVKKRYATLYSSSSQTANLLPLYLGITPENNIEEVLATLVQDLEVTRAWHINTGVVGLKFIFDVLIAYGYEDLAYHLITQITFPSFGYQILKENATTLWERWEFLSNDKCFNSHSHPFAGSVDVYFYKILAGIGIDEQALGYRNIILKPVLSGNLPYASASVDSVRGKVVSNWKRDQEKLEYHIEVPGNTTATVYIPKNHWDKVNVEEDGILCFPEVSGMSSEGLCFLREEEKYVVFAAQAGSYDFTITKQEGGE
ncbi:MAG: family 78 glycoside hydrolase catalytic domain [Eubacteriales bacterium]|nr:family 78 glycoside hydrolase catalytic domain [Eubacteriales bacterium]